MELKELSPVEMVRYVFAQAALMNVVECCREWPAARYEDQALSYLSIKIEQKYETNPPEVTYSMHTKFGAIVHTIKGEEIGSYRTIAGTLKGTLAFSAAILEALVAAVEKPETQPAASA